MFKILIALLSLSAQFAFAAEVLEPACKKKIAAQALNAEESLLGLKLTDPSVEVWAWKNKKDDSLSIRVEVLDQADGRSAAYETRTQSLIEQDDCDFTFTRPEAFACRYSTTTWDNEIVKTLREVTLNKNSKFSAVEVKQLKATLNSEDGQTVQSAIEGVDGEEVYKDVLLLPNGTKVDYWKYYGGDNPFGAFFLFNTSTLVGTNSDGDLCIGYGVE